MAQSKILYVDTPMINRTGFTYKQSTIIYNCNTIDPKIIDIMSQNMQELAVSSFCAAGRFFCIISIDAINKNREMVIIELGNTEKDLNILLDFMSQGETKATQDQRIKVTECFRQEYAPNYDKQFYDFEVEAGSPV